MWFLVRCLSIGWIAMKFGTDIHGAQRMSPNVFVDSLTCLLAPPVAQSFHRSSEISQHLLDRVAWDFVQIFIVTR